MSLDPASANSGTYHSQTPWRPWWASIATLCAVGLSIAASIAVGAAIKAGTGADFADFERPAAWASMLGFQVVAALAAWWLAGWFGGNRRGVLALAQPTPAANVLVPIFLVMALTSLAYTFLIYWWQPAVVRADMATFGPMVHARIWPIYALIIVVGAPLSEELLFRGFLQSALAKSRLGFLGASVGSTFAWGALHIQYSIYGLAEIFVVGFFFCWVLWRTGSLRATMLLHGLYNGAQFVGMMFRLFPWT